MRATLLNASTGRFVDSVGATHSAQRATAFPLRSVPSDEFGVADGLPDAVRSRLGDTRSKLAALCSRVG